MMGQQTGGIFGAPVHGGLLESPMMPVWSMTPMSDLFLVGRLAYKVYLPALERRRRRGLRQLDFDRARHGDRSGDNALHQEAERLRRRQFHADRSRPLDDDDDADHDEEYQYSFRKGVQL